jgi:GxxExxY protein
MKQKDPAATRMVALDSPTEPMLWSMQGELLEAERVHSIIGAFFKVYNYYGYGLSEAIYAGALEYELRDRGHDVVRELLVAVSYYGRHVGWQRIDMVVDNAVVVENKATERLSPVARPQTINYLRVTPFQVAVLLHFGPHPRFYRFIDFPKRPAEWFRDDSR